MKKTRDHRLHQLTRTMMVNINDDHHDDYDYCENHDCCGNHDYYDYDDYGRPCRDLVGTWTSSSTLFLSAAAPLSSITLTSEKVEQIDHFESVKI